MKALLERIRKILRDRRTRKFLTRLVSGVAAVVVFITTYALVLPAITMESQAACGLEAHQHDDSCYTDELICGQEESEGHHHTEDCYTVTKDLVCSLEEHQHSAENGCYDENGNLICKLEEHTHTDSCYEEHRELTCGLEETDGHTHTDSCYKKVLTCGKPVHTHSAACYKADPEFQSAAVASTGMTSAAAMSDYSEEEYAQEESHDGSIGSQAFDEPEEIGAEEQNPGEEIIDEGSSSAETEDNQDANQDADIKDVNADKEISDEGISQAETENDPATDLENENADDNSVAAESDDMNRNDDSESKDEKDEKADAFETGDTAFEESADEENLNTEDEDNDNNADREGEESASSFSTGFAAEEDEDSFIPEKEALDFNTVLNNKTGIYYHHLEAGETVEDSSTITDWIRVDEDTELSPEDLIRVYLGYTLPADAINATNDIARYRLPDTLHLTDEQIDAINKCENGISSQYVDYSKLEITDIERHAAYLGLESVEGTRTPDEELKEDSQEYISATVKAEKIYDEDGKYEGTDLIFTFSPYTVEKNAHAYDKDGQPTKAGEKVKGWLMLDFNLGQVDWSEDRTSEIVFAKEDEENHITEIRTVLRQANPSEDEVDDIAADGMTEAAAEYATEEIASEYATEEIAAEDMTAETSSTDTTAEVANSDATGEAAAVDSTGEKAGESSTDDATTETAKNLSDDKTAQEKQTAASYPAAVFDDSISVRSGRLDTDLADTDLPRKTKMTVHVEADEGTFPEGTKMVLSPVEDLNAVAEAVGTAVDAKTRGFQAVDITFYDKDPSEEGAKEIEPLKPIRVSIKSDEIRKAAEDSSTAPVVVHIEDDNTATEIENTASKTDTAAIEIEKPGVEEGNISSESKTTDDNSAVQEKENDVVNTAYDNHQRDNSESDADGTSSVRNIADADSKMDNDIDYAIDPDDNQTNDSDSNTEYNNEKVPAVTIIEPADTEAYGENQTEKSSRIENTTDTDNTDDVVSFEADSFSVYAVVYTVDFFWEVDGKTYTFALAGGDSISLRNLMNVLGIIGKDEANQEDETANDESDGTTPSNILSKNDKHEYDQFINDIEKVEFTDESLIKPVPITKDVTAGELKKQLKLEIEYSAELTEEQITEMEAKQFTPPDWALMVLNHFDTEETLTVTMKDGAVWAIRVTDPVTDTAPRNMTVLPTVDTRSQGVKMWLFDYDLQGKLDHKDNKANQLTTYNVVGTNTKYGDYGINSGSALKFLGWGAGNSVKAYDSSGNTGFGINDFTGLDENNTNRIRALQGIVQNELSNGYPVLQDGTSLGYLFDPTLNTADRAVYGGTTKDSGNITGLFELGTDGYYIYDSDEHYAQLEKNGNNYTNNFTVYTTTLAQTNKNGGNHNPVRAVGFFPFDSYSHVYNDLKYENDPYHYDDRGTLYLNPDGDQGNSGLNHHLGVAMEMDFIIPKDGKTDTGDPIQFRFSGDDDMWVFIDDQLVLDIGGLHQPVDGVIDFSTGKAKITGKATVAGHSDNTGSNAIGVIQNVTNNRGNDFEFYPSMGLTGGDGKTHTMKIFYLERGGCDSNCMISFNLPLVKGRGEVKIAKYDSTANPVAPLSGVKFGIYSDPQCREEDLIEEVTSSSAGLLDFSDLGIKDDNQKYYIKETKPLPGYKPNDTVYTLKVEDDGSNGYTFGVYVYNEEGVYNNKIDTIGDQPARPVIYNEERKPIDLTVEKVWQKPTMEAFTPTEDDNLSATFKVQRYVRSEGDRVIPDASQPVTFNVYRIKGNNTTSLFSTNTLKGKSKVYVNWEYRPTYVNYDYSNRYNKYKYNTTGGSYSTKSGTGPLEITLPENGTANLYIRDEDYGTQYGDGVLNITVNGTPYNPQNTTEHFSTDWVLDSTYNNDDECPVLSLPEDLIDENHPWMGKFSNLPLYRTEGDTTYYYKYFIIEADSIEGYETIYVDGDGHQIGSPSSLATVESNSSSPQKIINRKLMDIPVEKTWPDYTDDEFTWTAKFQLDYRNVPLEGDSGEEEETGNAYDPSGNWVEGPEASWEVYVPHKIVEISKGDTVQQYFEDLPMYYTDENGVTWRREYSVRELEYKVWKVDEHGTKIEPPIVSKTTDGTTGYEYTLWYRQDAGEDYDENGIIDENDYVISIENLLAHREIKRKINISLDKAWPAGTNYAISPDAKAVFKLKRYIVEEYRNYEGISADQWVEITLKTGDGNDQTLRVPRGQRMYIRGYLKGGTSNQNISFTCSAGSDILPYSDDNSSNPDQKAFSIGFIADITKDIELTNGADDVSGGIYGFHLSDAGSLLTAKEDNHFSREFELNSSNNWHADFTDLPFVEVIQMNEGLTATTFVYSYYFEEVECVPESFYPTFTDSDGQVLLGDENNRIIFTTDISANNKPIGFDILKVDKTDTSRKLPNAEFKLIKLTEDDDLHYPVATNNGTFGGTLIGTSETAQETGQLTFDELLPGYYEVAETKAPAGYVILTDSSFYIKVEKTGDIFLLKKQVQGDTVILVEASSGEMVGNASITSSKSTDGKTIILTVSNEPGTALPNTGGPGTSLSYLFGIMLTGLAGAGLVMKKRRRNAA